MKERLIEFLKAENKSSAQFADEIGVQPSGISHILSGRNNPSLDFVLKMLEKYKYLSTDWLLFGKGTMYKENSVQTLFDNLDPIREIPKIEKDREPANSKFEYGASDKQENVSGTKNIRSGKKSDIKKIVWFFENNEFEEFNPVNK